MDKTPRYLEATVKPMMDILAGKYTQSNQSANLRREIRQIMCEGKILPKPAPNSRTNRHGKNNAA